MVMGTVCERLMVSMIKHVWEGFLTLKVPTSFGIGDRHDRFVRRKIPSGAFGLLVLNDSVGHVVSSFAFINEGLIRSFESSHKIMAKRMTAEIFQLISAREKVHQSATPDTKALCH